jgi:hypothetical protein
MAAKKKAAKAGAVAAAPYVQRVISDAELRENVRTAFESARDALTRLSNGNGPAKTVLDDKKFHRSVSDAATALKDASDAIREAPKKRKAAKKRKGGIARKLLVLAVGGAIALAVSENLRNKVLDQLFGKEEEFEYTSTTSPSTPPPAAPAPSEPAATAS